METSIGTFEFFDGVPTNKSGEMAYDFLDKVNAYKALLSTTPTVSNNELWRGQAAIGAEACNQICISDTLMDSTGLFLTGNTSMMYALGFLDLENDGPTAIELLQRRSLDHRGLRRHHPRQRREPGRSTPPGSSVPRRP